MYLQFIGDQIKKACRAKQWTQTDLANRVGVDQKEISAIENGKSNITLVTLLKLAKALEIDKMDLHFGPERRISEWSCRETVCKELSQLVRWDNRPNVQCEDPTLPLFRPSLFLTLPSLFSASFNLKPSTSNRI